MRGRAADSRPGSERACMHCPTRSRPARPLCPAPSPPRSVIPSNNTSTTTYTARRAPPLALSAQGTPRPSPTASRSLDRRTTTPHRRPGGHQAYGRPRHRLRATHASIPAHHVNPTDAQPLTGPTPSEMTRTAPRRAGYRGEAEDCPRLSRRRPPGARRHPACRVSERDGNYW
jgi:hypothetical protein